MPLSSAAEPRRGARTRVAPDKYTPDDSPAGENVNPQAVLVARAAPVGKLENHAQATRDRVTAERARERERMAGIRDRQRAVSAATASAAALAANAAVDGGGFDGGAAAAERARDGGGARGRAGYRLCPGRGRG